MKNLFKTLLLLLLATTFTNVIQGQIYENTYNWGAFDHSAWKVHPNSPTGYVIIGNKFFESGNTNIYAQGFNETGTSQWLRTHASGFSFLEVLWKSSTVTPNGNYFTVVTGVKSGPKAYALLLNSNGHKIWDRASVIPSGIYLGGVTNANNSGWIACGSDDNGFLITLKFDEYGNLQWTNSLAISSFGWTIIQAPGGGYLIGSTNKRVTKIDNSGNLVWSTVGTLPNSPAPDGTAYSYTEFEELINLPNGEGVILTGSAFSNSTSASYTLRVNYDGSFKWSTVHDPQNTGNPGTPVAWINSAIIDGPNVVTSWRRGPVSAGGTMYYQRQYVTGEPVLGVISLGNTIPVQEAFMIKAHGKYIIGGTRGSYTGAYSYITSSLPFPTSRRSEEAGQLMAETNILTSRVQINRNNTKPIFEYPLTSRVFRSEMRVFPNPSTGLINIGGKIEPGATLRVTDIMGRIVLEKQIPTGEESIKLDLTRHSKGVYNVEMTGTNQTVAKKVVIQ